jgi:hypothetical protein
MLERARGHAPTEFERHFAGPWVDWTLPWADWVWLVGRQNDEK